MTIWKADIAGERLGVITGPGAPLLLRSPSNAAGKSWRILCLLDDEQRKNLRSTARIEFVLDPESDFDFFIALSPAAKDVFEELLPRCGNPAAPLISVTDVFASRADAVVEQPTASAIAGAISSLTPLAARVGALPSIPPGADRNGLLALALAYTRSTAIKARWQPCSPELVGYPLLFGVENPRTVLEDLANGGFLRRRFHERLHVCGQCDSSQLHARETCINCRSSHLAEHALIHHYSCGFQAAQTAFEHRDGYVCPKCHKLLRHYGVDYDKPGFVTECLACGGTMAEPEVGFICTRCGTYTAGDHAAKRDWYHYELLADGLAALRAGALPHADIWPGTGYSLRDFCLVVTHALSVAEQHQRPLTAWTMTVDTDALTQEVGRRGVVEICQFLLELVKQNLGDSDVVSALPTGVVACMSETERTEAEAKLQRIREQIGSTLKSKPELKFELFGREEIGTLLRDLN
ncbi:hypothetical protein [Chelativorans sp. J32]|uniref:TackOD1 domain-containing metal-binding protein n=1 Tax=Chelativorans sp. J32 TaxID=935840 RepID=UPI000484C489|nr:hypothetical protein [Chelativorans sp. J32]